MSSFDVREERPMTDANQDWALVDSRQRLTRKQADFHMRQIAGRLVEDLGPGDRFLICAANSVEHVLAMGGGLYAGRGSVPVSPMSTADELFYILRDSRSSLIFAGPEGVGAALEAAATVSTMTVVGWRCDSQTGLTPWREWIVGPSASLDFARKAVPQFHYTSGMTGRPKAVPTPPTLLPAETTIDAMFRAL
jgi:acyl-CoA synthetase (AMP-forming)/AMP-acid ligase II